ncbi:MAG: hypothetical protein AAGF88_12630 [Pseudomonadota bacterium]
MKQSDLHKMAHVCLLIFDAYGLTVSETGSAAEFEDRMALIGKPPNRKTLDPNSQLLFEHRISAILLQHKGQDIGGVIARSLDLGARPVADLLDAEAGILYDSDRPPKLTSPTSHQMQGIVAYCGEMWFKPTGPGEKWRGLPGLSPALVRYIQTHAFGRWGCDWVYGIIKKGEVEDRGRAVHYGFCCVEPNLQSFEDVDEDGRDSSEYLVANSRDQFAHVIRCCTEDPHMYFPGFEEISKGVADGNTRRVAAK